MGGITWGSETITYHYDYDFSSALIWVVQNSTSGDMCSARPEVKLYFGNGVPGKPVTMPANCTGTRTWLVGCRMFAGGGAEDIFLAGEFFTRRSRSHFVQEVRPSLVTDMTDEVQKSGCFYG